MSVAAQILIAEYRKVKRAMAEFKKTQPPGSCTRGFVLDIQSIAERLEVLGVDFPKLRTEVEAELQSDGLGRRRIGS